MSGRCRYPSESQALREEQAIIGQPVALRIRRSQLENELRQPNSVIGEHLRAAIEAASAHVITAAGGSEVAGVYPLALRVQEDLVRHRAIPHSKPHRPPHFPGASVDVDCCRDGDLGRNPVWRGAAAKPV